MNEEGGARAADSTALVSALRRLAEATLIDGKSPYWWTPNTFDGVGINDYHSRFAGACDPETILALLDQLTEALRQRDDFEFQLRGLDLVRQKDNQYLLDRIAAASTVLELAAVYRETHPCIEPKNACDHARELDAAFAALATKKEETK